MTNQRSLPVPEGLDGERLDAALSRMFGLSRARAAELIAAGDVLVDGSAAAKSERVHGGAWQFDIFYSAISYDKKRQPFYIYRIY